MRMKYIALAAVSLLSLTACNEDKKVEVPEGAYFADLEACKAVYSEKECREYELFAEKEYEATAPRYTDSRSCEEKHGPAACQSVRRDDGTSVFMPMMLGFMMANMMNNNNSYRPQVVYRDVTRVEYRPYTPPGRTTYTAPTYYKPSTTWTPTARPPSAAPTVVPSVPARIVRPTSVPSVPAKPTPAPATTTTWKPTPPAPSAPSSSPVASSPATMAKPTPAPVAAPSAPSAPSVISKPSVPSVPSVSSSPSPRPTTPSPVSPSTSTWKPSPSTSSSFRSSPSFGGRR